MRSPVRKRLGAALAAVAVALALTSCTSSPPASSSAAADAARAASATSQSLKLRAEKAAEAVLASVPMPPGGDRWAAPLSLPAPQSPSIYVVAAWEAHLTAYLEAPGSPRAVLASTSRWRARATAGRRSGWTRGWPGGSPGPRAA